MNKIIASLVLFGISQTALAAVVRPQRQAEKIQFNQMIQENDSASKELQNNATETPAPEKLEQAQVINFIDVEIGVGQAPKVSDRRF